MRKNFLILMLMSLLPLAGWAEDISVADVAVGDITYGDAAPTTLLVVWKGETLNKDTHYTWDGAFFDDAACTKASAAPLKAGVHYIKIAGIPAGGFSGEAVGSFTVNKAELTFTLKANQLDRTFGDAAKALNDDATVDFNMAGFIGTENWAGVKKGSKPTYSTSSNNAGDYSTATPAKKLTFTGGWTPDNYTITYVGALNIAQKNISGTATITAWQGDVVYTGKDITPVYTVKDKADGIVLTAETDYTVSKAKTVAASPYTPTITFQGNYTGAIVVAAEKSFDVTAAPITVSIDDQEVTYNSANQGTLAAGSLTYYYSGIVGDDIDNAATIKATFTAPTSVTAGTAVDAGDYTLTISGGSGAGNYYFKDYLPANLKIKKAEITITADAKSKKYGTSDPGLTFNSAGVKGSTWSFDNITLSRANGEDVGTYDITPDVSAATIREIGTYNKGWRDVTANYTFKAVKGTFTIEQGGIVVTIKDAEKFYGEADPEFTYAVTGLFGGDELAPFTITRDAGEAAGKGPGKSKGYSLTATVVNPNPTKYETVTVVPGILTIKKAQLEFSCDALSVKKDATDAEKTAALNKSLITVTGINNSDAAANLYDLSYKGDVVFNADNTDDDGVVATLKATKLITENEVDYTAQDLYEIVTDKNTDPWTVNTTTNFKLIVGDGTDAPLAFTSIDADYATIQAHAGETQNVTLTLSTRKDRQVPAGTKHNWAAQTWNTMVLPFEVSVADLSRALGYAIVNRVDASKTTEGNVQFKLEMDKIPANEPFCVKTTTAIADDYVITFPNKVKIVDGGLNPSVDAGNGYTFVGNYKTFAIDKTKSTFNFLRGDNVKWAHIGASSANTWSCVPFDAYVDLTAAAAPEMVTFTFQEIDGSTTAIKNVEASVNDGSAVKTGWYTIDGKKLNAAPAQKGIYIYNGKKFVVK